MYNPIFRYAVGVFGANLAQPDPKSPNHWIMCESYKDVEETLRLLGDPLAPRIHERAGDGGSVYRIPLFGKPDDGAYVYRVNRSHPDFSEVLDEPGDRARHAFGFVDWNAPVRVYRFGPRGGLSVQDY